MENLGKAVQKAKANALDEPRLKALAAKRERAITVNLVHCYEALNTYGEDPENIKSKKIVFGKVLSGYSAEAIESAFQRYFETGKGIPEPSDILKILKAWAVYNRPEYKVSPSEETHPRYIDLSEDGRAQIDESLQRAKESLYVEPKKEHKPAPNLFYRMPVEAQKAVLEECKKSVKNPK